MDQLKPIAVMFTEEEIAWLSFAFGTFVGATRGDDRAQNDKTLRQAQALMDRINVARDRAKR